VRTSLWRMINHYSVRTWPWIICGLAMVFLLSDSEMLSLNVPSVDGKVDWELGYPVLISKFMPAGLVGLMVAGFLAAFMSSMGENVLTNATIFLNDLYRPFVRKEASEKHYLGVIRLMMTLITVMAIVVALVLNDILGLFGFIIMVTRGAGFIPVLRWFWWRVNAWADLTARVSVFGVVYFYDYGPGMKIVNSVMTSLGASGWDAKFAVSFLLTVTTVTVLSLIVMFLTPPDSTEKLMEFYRRVRPYGWWGPIARACPEVKNPDSAAEIFRLCTACALYGFGGILTLGALFLGHWHWSLVGLVLVVGSIKFILKETTRLY